MQRAAIIGANAEGEQFRATSLTRIYGDLIAPAVRDLLGIEGHVVDTVPIVPKVNQPRRAWSAIEITMTETQVSQPLRAGREGARQRGI